MNRVGATHLRAGIRQFIVNMTKHFGTNSLICRTLVLLFLLTATGCSDTQDKAIAALQGTWIFELLKSRSHHTSDKTFELKILLDEGWFGSDLTTDCGIDGPFGDWSGDWREVEVEWHRAPKGSVSGGFTIKCITDVFPVSGYLIRGLFYGDLMVGKITHQVDRGNKNIGPIHEATHIVLFIARRVSMPIKNSSKFQSKISHMWIK